MTRHAFCFARTAGATLALASLALAPACSKKNGSTTPTGQSSGTVTTEGGAAGMGAAGVGGAAELDPATGLPVTGDGSGATLGDAMTDAEAAGAGQPGDDGPAPLEPPTLDKSPAEVQRLVGESLKDGQAAISTQRPEDAIAAARRALKEDEVNVPAMLLLAQAYYHKGYYDKTEAILDIAKKRPDGATSAHLYFLFGLTYTKTDRPDQSLAAFEKTLEIEPNHKSALLNVGAAYLKLKRYTDATQLLERLTTSLGDNRPASWTNMGSAYRGRSIDYLSDRGTRNQLLMKAETAYKRAISINNRHSAAYYNLGLLYLDADPFPAPDGNDLDKLKRLERAKTYFREYRALPDAALERVDEQTAVVEKLYDREVKRRAKRRKMEEKRRKLAEKKRKREAAKKAREAAGNQ